MSFTLLRQARDFNPSVCTHAGYNTKKPSTPFGAEGISAVPPLYQKTFTSFSSSSAITLSRYNGRSRLTLLRFRRQLQGVFTFFHFKVFHLPTSLCQISKCYYSFSQSLFFCRLPFIQLLVKHKLLLCIKTKLLFLY